MWSSRRFHVRVVATPGRSQRLRDVTIPTARLLLAWVVMLLSASCAPRLMDLPVGPGHTNDTAAPAWFAFFEAAQDECRFHTLAADVAVRGVVEGQPVRGRFQFVVSPTSASPSLQFEPADGTPPISFSDSQTGSTYVYRGAFTVAGRKVNTIESVVPLPARDLYPVLTGCQNNWNGENEEQRFDDTWVRMRIGDQPEAYVRRRGATWTLAAIIGRAPGRTSRWRAEFHRNAHGWPARVRVLSHEWNGEPGKSFDVTLNFRRVRVSALDGSATLPQGARISGH